MNICIILPRPFPPEIRVEKEWRTLQPLGHTFHVVCAQRDGEPLRDKWRGIAIYRVQKPRRRFGKLSSLLHMPSFMNPIWTLPWRRLIRQVIRENAIDILNPHDLPLAYESMRLAREYNLPMCFEMHENWPEALRAWGKERFYDYLFASVRIHKWFERLCVHNSTHILVVVDEQKERLVRLGVPAEKITVVLNTEDVAHFTQGTIDPAIAATYRDNFVISYIGGVGPHRGVDTVIRAMPRVLQSQPNALFLIVGAREGPYLSRLRQLIAECGVANAVVVINWVPFDKVASYINASHVCTVPHHKSGHTETTIPHKLFQYMVMSRPIVVTDVKPLKRIVEAAEAGLVAEAGNPADIARAILQLTDPVLRTRLGSNGRRAAEQRFNWDLEARKLITMYQELYRRRQAAAPGSLP